MTAVEELVYHLDEAFSGKGIEESNESQSLLVNLASVGESLWRKVPPSGVRTIESIALHVGGCKVMYDEYAFGRGALAWNDGQVQPWARGEAPMDDTVLWLKQAHERFRGHVRALNDSDLAELRQTNWGEPRDSVADLDGPPARHVSRRGGEPHPQPRCLGRRVEVGISART